MPSSGYVAMFEQITTDQLAQKLDSADQFALIDTRPVDSYEAWHIPGAENCPFGLVETLSDQQQTWIDTIRDSQPIVTICGKGVTSTNLAAELDANGYDDVAVVKGGMRDWNARYEQCPIDTNDDRILIQFQRRAKGCLSYLVGSRDEAVVVDPTRHLDQYIVGAAEAGVEITRVLDTHIHADHISGGRRLADRLGVPYHLGAPARDRADYEYEFQPLDDGETLHVGDIEITALHAPGHTSELMAYRTDRVIFTGDALFLDSVGRTELEFGDDEAETGARLEYETLHETLFEQPDDLIVLPGHVTVTNSGEYRNGSPGKPVSALLADVRERLDVLSVDEDEFIDQMTSNQEKPANYETIIEFNRGVRSFADEDVADLETGANNCSA